MHIETHRLCVCVDQLDSFDRVAAEEEIWLTEEDKRTLKKSTGTALLVYGDQEVMIAAGYYLPASELQGEFDEIDPLFQIADDEAYIYSVVVHPDYRRKGIGTKLRLELCQDALLAGFINGVTHARQKRDWGQTGVKFYKPFEQRLVEGYWGEVSDPDVLFMRFSLSGVA